MQKHKLLILGMGHSQRDLAEKAQEMGLEVHAAANKIGGPVVEFADHVVALDILNVDEVKAYCESEAIDFLFTMGLEVALPVIEQVSEELGLPHFFSSETMAKFEDKYEWRQALAGVKGNLKNMSGSEVTDFADWEHYPAFLKPVDSSGQRGVYRVDSYEEVKEVFDQSIENSKKKELILEEFAGGEEVSVNSFMLDGELKFHIVSDRISHENYPGGIIKAHVIPTKYQDPQVLAAIEQLVKDVNQRMGITDGHVYFQLKIEDNQPKLIEFTPRYDGCHMWLLVREATDLDLVQCSLEWLISGKSQTLSDYKFHVNPGKFVTRFISDKPETVVDRSQYELPEDPELVRWYYEDGDQVNTVTGYIEKVGFTITKEEN